MTRTFPGIRRVLAILATLGLLMSAFPAMTAAVGAAGPPSGDGIQPVALAGNQNCTAANADFELRVNAPGDGTFTHAATGFSITLDVRDTAAGQVFDYTSSGGTIFVIYVKAGPDTNRYTYPTGSDGADTGLHGTINPSNGRYYGLSHISICFDDIATPAIVTQVSDAAITIGDSVTDTATLSGGVSPTGTITFNVYGPNDATCSGTATLVSTETVNGNGNYTSDSFTPPAVGTYLWIASYSGDANNAAVSGACNDANETVVVSQATPAIVTQVSDAAITIGDSVTDTATLSGGVSPTGTITFNVYGPNDATCSGTATLVSTETVNGNGNYTSDSFTPPAVGTYLWIASYSGDANNAAVSGACNDANETVVVSLNEPELSTAPWVIPQDDATLAALIGSGPFGTLEFELFDNADCTGDPVYSETVTVTGNDTFSTSNSGDAGTNDGFKITADGTFYWVVTYSGNASNAGATSDCGDEILDVDITPDPGS